MDVFFKDKAHLFLWIFVFISIVISNVYGGYLYAASFWLTLSFTCIAVILAYIDLEETKNNKVYDRNNLGLKNDNLIEDLIEDLLIEEISNIPEIKQSGLDSVVNCLNLNEYKDIPNESKLLLKQSVKWQQTLYKSNPNLTQQVLNIEQNLENESKQEEKKYKSFLDVNDAKQCTDNILSNVTGDLNDKNTLFQIISQSAPNVMFYDPKVKTDSIDEKIDKNEAVLKLTFVPGTEYINDNILSKKAQKQLISEMKYSINNNANNVSISQSHPIINKTRSSIAEAYGVNHDQIIITDVYYGSACFKYKVTNSEKHENIFSDPSSTQKLKNKFKYFESNKIHPSMFNAFNVNDFDSRGTKSFDSASTFEIGPPGKKQKYTQPGGWTRYGLNVLNGKYGNDNTWLDPFNHNNNWYRAYHGVRGVKGEDMSLAKLIHDGGFLPGGAQACSNHDDSNHPGKKLGVGVYCTPDINVAANSYGGNVSLKLNNGETKRFKFVFQVCVDPNKIGISSSCPNYWVAPNSIGKVGGNPHVEDNIRPYGILLKEI